MKVLVTGGAGYIGAVVTDQLLNAGHEVVVVDDLSTGHADAVPAAVTFHKMPLSEIADVVTAREGFDAVLHFAGLIAAGESVQRPELYWRANVAGSIALLAAIHDARVPRLVFSSSAAVYGNPVSTPITEAATPAPTSPYGWTKLAIDVAIGHECAATDLAAVSLRYFNVAGAIRRADGTLLGERHDPETHLIPLALEVAEGRRGRLQLFGDDYPTRDGTCVRDYIHVEDLARAHLLALEHAPTGRHAIYNLGSGRGFTNAEVIDVVRAVTGHPIPVDTVPRRPGDPAELVASYERAESELGWVPVKPDLATIVGDAWEFRRRRSGSRS